MQVSMTMGQRAMVHYLFSQVLTKPSFDEAMMMLHLRRNLRLNELPEGKLSAASLEAELVVEEETARWKWLLEKIRAAFSAGQMHSAYSDYAVELVTNLEPVLRAG